VVEALFHLPPRRIGSSRHGRLYATRHFRSPSQKGGGVRMRSEDDWTRFGDEHPVRAGLAQAGIYVLIWVGVIACLMLAAFLFALLAKVGP
jgi:hypothetical protein